MPGRRHALALGLAQEALDVADPMVGDDLRQVEICRELAVADKRHLAGRIAGRIGPAAERQRRMALANELPQLPGVFDRAGAAHVFVAAEHDQRREPVLHDLIGVAEAEVESSVWS